MAVKPIVFTVVLEDGSQLALGPDKINKFISSEKKKFSVKNNSGVIVFKKVFRG